jgi:hypothetical protein
MRSRRPVVYAGGAVKETITIPRLEGETNRAYAARVEYITAGPQRDLRSLAQKLDKSLTIVGRWSSQYDWVEHARRYDDTLAGLAIQEAAEQYRADLAEYRQRYQKAGKDLYAVAQGMLGMFANNLRGKTIKGEDGKTYTIPAVELNASTLGQVKAAFQTAADLEALALRVEHLLGKLTTDAEPGTE